MKKRANPPQGKPIVLDPSVTTLLQQIAEGKTVLHIRKGKRIFAQGEKADAIYFIESGRVKLSVVSAGGKEAVLSMLHSPSFVGEGCMVGHSLRVATATALETTTVFRVDKNAMLKALHDQTGLAEKFTAALLTRNIDLEADLCDQLFNHSEKRLARVLLKLSRLRDNDPVPDTKIAPISHELLAEMVGTTRSRVTHFMNKFRKLGLIDYNGVLTVRTGALTDIVLHD